MLFGLQLQFMGLSSCEVEDKHLQSLRCCPELRVLELRDNKITVAGLVALAESYKLITMLLLDGINSPKADDKNVNKLFSLLPNLQRLATWSYPHSDHIHLLARLA